MLLLLICSVRYNSNIVRIALFIDDNFSKSSGIAVCAKRFIQNDEEVSEVFAWLQMVHVVVI